jgi:hypothetical protein
MVDIARVEAFIAHYADPYYDPGKAHEYYLENRQLAGKPVAAATPPKKPSKKGKGPSAASLQAAARKASNQRQAEALAYSSKQISNHKKADSIATNEANKARVAKLRNDANATKTRIEQGLKDAIAKLDASTKIKLEVPKLNEIPANASPAQKKFLQEQNHKLQARADAKNRAAQKVANTDKTTGTKQENAQVRAQKLKMANDLKAAVAKARSDYAAAKSQLTSNYKQISINEKANIKANVH